METYESAVKDFATSRAQFKASHRGVSKAERKALWIEWVVEQVYGTGSQPWRHMVHNLAHGICDTLKSLSDPLVFLMELIQNAEDARYASARPTFDLYLHSEDLSHTPGCVGAAVVVLNELGFSARDVWQLSSLGLSFKKLDKSEGGRTIIGEKGLGFKSVFRVTSRPCIFSNGYAFSYSPDPDPATGLGYVIPRLVEDAALVERFTSGRFAGKTVIYLPLLEVMDSSTHGGALRDLRFHLNRLEAGPEVLLFLPTLQHVRIHMEDGAQWRNLFFEKYVPARESVVTLVQRTTITDGAPDDSTNFCDALSTSHQSQVHRLSQAYELSFSQAAQFLKDANWVPKAAAAAARARAADASQVLMRYFVTRVELARPASVCRPAHDPRLQLASSTLTVALPLFRDEEDVLRPRRSLFSYLPCNERTEWKFIVNGDFVLNASREELLMADNDYVALAEPAHWNSWLLLQVPRLFASAFMAVMQSPDVPRHQKLLLYHAIPLADVPKFRGISTLIYRELRSRACLLTCADSFQAPRVVNQAGPFARSINFLPHDPVSHKLVSMELERDHGQLLDADHLNVPPLTLAQWKAIFHEMPEWLFSLTARDFLSLTLQLEAFPPSRERTQLKSVAFLPSVNNEHLLEPRTAYMKAAAGKGEDNVLRADLSAILDTPRKNPLFVQSRNARLFLEELGLLTPDAAGQARELIEKAVRALDENPDATVEEKATICTDLLYAVAVTFFPLSLSAKRDLVRGMPLLLIDGTVSTQEEANVLFKHDEEVVARLGRWPFLRMLHPQYRDVFQKLHKATVTVHTEKLSVLDPLMDALDLRSMRDHPWLPHCLYDRGSLPDDEHLIFFADPELGNSRRKAPTFHCVPAPSFLFAPGGGYLVARVFSSTADLKSNQRTAKALAGILLNKADYLVSDPRTVPADNETLRLKGLQYRDAALRKSRLETVTALSAAVHNAAWWPCQVVGSKSVLLPPHLVFHAESADGATLPISAGVLTSALVRGAPEADVARFAAALLRPFSPEAVRAWLDELRGAAHLPLAVKSAYLDPPQVTKTYEYLRRHNQVVTHIIVENESIELSDLVWEEPPPSVHTEFAVSFLSGKFPADMQAVCAWLGVAMQLPFELAFAAWDEALGRPNNEEECTYLLRCMGEAPAANVPMHRVARMQLLDTHMAPMDESNRPRFFAATQLYADRMPESLSSRLLWLPREWRAQKAARSLYGLMAGSWRQASVFRLEDLISFEWSGGSPPRDARDTELWTQSLVHSVLDALFVFRFAFPDAVAPTVDAQLVQTLCKLRVAVAANRLQLTANARAASPDRSTSDLLAETVGELKATCHLDPNTMRIVLVRAARGKVPAPLSAPERELVAQLLANLLGVTDTRAVDMLRDALTPQAWAAVRDSRWPGAQPLRLDSPSQALLEALPEMDLETNPKGKEEEEEDDDDDDNEEEDQQGNNGSASSSRVSSSKRVAVKRERGEEATPMPTRSKKAAATPPAAAKPASAAKSAKRQKADAAAASPEASSSAQQSKQKRSRPARATSAPLLFIDENHDVPRRKRDSVYLREPESRLPSGWPAHVEFFSIPLALDAQSRTMISRPNALVEVRLLPPKHPAARPGYRARGVFAARDLAAGRRLGVMGGETTWKALNPSGAASAYYIEYGRESLSCDSERVGNEMRFLNSNAGTGRQPNVCIVEDWSDELNVLLPYVQALEPIAKGQELLLAYVDEVQDEDDVRYLERE